MKSLIIILTFVLALITKNVLACQISIPTSETQRYIDAFEKTGQGVPPLYKCEDKPDETCHCQDDVEAWDEVILIDEVDEAGIYTDKKLLRKSPIKKLEKEAKEKAEKDAEVVKHDKKKAIREKFKNLKKSDYSSNAKTVDLLMEVIELIKE